MKKANDYRRIDKDPVIDLIRTGVETSGRRMADITARAGIHYNTLHNWLYGRTRRPQNITIELVLLELGMERRCVWRKSGKAVTPTRGES